MRTMSRRSFVGLMAISAAMALTSCSGQAREAAHSESSTSITGFAENAEPAKRDEALSPEEERAASATNAAALPAAFSPAARTVTLNDGFHMPTNGLGTYSLKGETCIASVKAALESGVRLLDTAHISAHIREDNDIYGFELTDEEMAAIAALDRNEKHDWY